MSTSFPQEANVVIIGGGIKATLDAQDVYPMGNEPIYPAKASLRGFYDPRGKRLR